MKGRKPRKLTVVASRSAEAALADGSDDSSFATTLAKGLAVLEAFEAGDVWVGNSELAARTGLARPTVARLSYTLAELGYLRYDETRAKYRLGARSLRMAHPLLAGLKFRQAARPLIQELAESVRGAVSIGLLDGETSVYVETARSGDVGPHTPDIGIAVPVVRTAVGRALAAMLVPEELLAVEARIKSEMPDDWLTYQERFRAGVRECTEQGFSTSRGDWVAATFAVAAPLFRVRETGDCFALNCGVPAFRLQAGRLEAEIGPRVRALAASIRAIAGEAEPTLRAPGDENNFSARNTAT